tara:strand:+ start:20097 stop:20576 length:480 start_codon:yes stop_codon:yes gene_type:complete
MIHGTYGSTVTSYLSLLESKINTSVVDSKLRWLFKFTNDMTKTVKYSYGRLTGGVVNDRYVKSEFLHNTTESVFTSNINFKPYGYWSYEVYEVSWIGTVAVNDTNAPNSETEVLSVANGNGVVQGKVHEGKLYVTETVGSEQIQYTEHTESTTNYLYAN